MARPPLPRDFVEFLSVLNSMAVEYLVIGGYPVNYHGYSRTTADFDVWIAGRSLERAAGSGRPCHVRISLERHDRC